MGVITSVLLLSVLIFVHELGHFLAARAFGVCVEVFSIGFGKKIFTKTIGSTEYAVSLIPLGGYVKMKGQDDTNPTAKSSDNDSYNSKHPWQRIVILTAGPFFNLLFAAFVYFGLAMYGTPTLAPVVGEVVVGSAAQKAGLQKSDRVLTIDGAKVSYWFEISDKIASKNGSSLAFELDRGGIVIKAALTPQPKIVQNIFGESINRYMIGIAPQGEMVMLSYGVVDALVLAHQKTLDAAGFIVKSLQKLVSGAVSSDNLGGVISIVQATSQASHSGLISVLLLGALISVNLGVINLLPIPALDGGHIIFNLYEMLTRKAPSEAVFMRLTIAGWVLLGALTVFGLYNDINRLVAAAQ